MFPFPAISIVEKGKEYIFFPILRGSAEEKKGKTMVESGKNKESVEITIPVVDDIPATSQSETASNGVATKHSEGLRRRPSSARRMMEESDTAAPQNELLLKRPSSNGRTKYTQTKSRVMEVEPTSPAVNSNLSRQSSGKEASSSFSKTCLSGRIESFNKPGALPPAHDHHKDEVDDDDDDKKQQDEKNDKGENPPLRKKTKKKGKITLVNIIGAVEWAIFVGVVAFLVASLCVDKLKTRVIWGLEIWKWCVLAAVFFCGHLVTQWAKDLIVFLIENKYFFNEKVVYFVHGMKQSVRVVIWLSLVFLAWFLLIDLRGGGGGGKRSRKTTRVLNYVTKALAGCLIGAVLWMIKTLLVKSIAASFHVKTFFSKIREAISHEYVLWTLSLPPKSTDSAENGGDGLSTCLCVKIPKWRKSSKGSKEKKEEEITIKKLGKMKAGKMPVSTMGHLIDRIRSSKLSIISSVLDDTPGLIGEQKQITSTPEVEDAASQIFHNVKNPNQE